MLNSLIICTDSHTNINLYSSVHTFHILPSIIPLINGNKSSSVKNHNLQTHYATQQASFFMSSRDRITSSANAIWNLLPLRACKHFFCFFTFSLLYFLILKVTKKKKKLSWRLLQFLSKIWIDLSSELKTSKLKTYTQKRCLVLNWFPKTKFVLYVHIHVETKKKIVWY